MRQFNYRDDTTRDGGEWIQKSRLQCYASETRGMRTTPTFWAWVLEDDQDRVVIRKIGRKTYVQLRSLRRYLGLEPERAADVDA